MKSVPCPRCGAQAVFAPENPWRPFCSERCKTIDLGAWANEEYRIPAPPEPPQDSEPEST
jgi:endogenous inhibitor of DNA gyrase (YacG/DUF329 family)